MSELGDLAELELDGRLTPEDVHENLELGLVFVDLGDLAREVGERTFFDPHGLALFVLETRTGLLRGLDPLDLDLKYSLHRAPRRREGLGPGTDEAGDAGRVADRGPRVVV